MVFLFSERERERVYNTVFTLYDFPASKAAKVNSPRGAGPVSKVLSRIFKVFLNRCYDMIIIMII